MYLVNDSKSIYVSLGNGDVCLGLNMAITGKSLSTKGHTTVKPKKTTVSLSLLLQIFLQTFGRNWVLELSLVFSRAIQI